MKALMLVILLVLNNSMTFAAESLLQKIDKVEADPSSLPGYEFDFDQVFKVASGDLKGKTLFFALKDHAQSGENRIPQFVISEGKKIIDHKVLPTIEDGWNIVQVEAISTLQPKSANATLRILAILTLEPMSGRSSDYWKQAFVFDVQKDGKISENVSLNTKLSKDRRRVDTIKNLKKYLSQQSE